MLVALAVVSIAGAVAIGVVGAVTVDPWIAASSSLVGGVHRRRVQPRARSAGASTATPGSRSPGARFPLLTAYFAAAGKLDLVAAAGAIFAYLSSRAQRTLSTPVRDVRRRVAHVEGRIDRLDGTSEPVTAELLVRANENALRALAGATVALAVALVLMRTL